MRPRTRPFSTVLLLAGLVSPWLAGAVPAAGAPADAVDGADQAADEVVVTAAEVVVTAAEDDLATVDCLAPYDLDAVLGCSRPLPDGMIEYVTPDGAVGTTHGPHHGVHGHAPGHDHEGHDHTPYDHDPYDHDPHDHDPHDHGREGADAAVTAASAGSRSLPSTRRPVACAADGAARTVVLYGHRAGANRLSDHVGAIRATVERSNQAVALSAQRSGGPLADLRVRCTSSGAVAVAAVTIGSNRFPDLRASLAAAGYDRPHEKYLLFADVDSPTANVAGIADMFLDDRRDVNNRNNGRSPMYAAVYSARNFGGSVALHELAHTMGAVQPAAPRADGHGHCTDQLDILCYPSDSTKCGTLAFDCGNDKYFSTATRPGQWLHTHWNLGWEGNRFIRLSSSSASSSQTRTGPGGFTDTAGHPHGASIAAAVERRIASGYPDGTFRPGQDVTRAQMATFLTRALTLPSGDAGQFRDVGRHPHAPGIGAVVRAAITQGYPDRTFRPDGVVTRGQLASFLDRALGLPPARGQAFADARGSAHEAAITRVAAAGIAEGYRDGTFRPGQSVSRGQMATFLVRALERR